MDSIYMEACLSVENALFHFTQCRFSFYCTHFFFCYFELSLAKGFVCCLRGSAIGLWMEGKIIQVDASGCRPRKKQKQGIAHTKGENAQFGDNSIPRLYFAAARGIKERLFYHSPRPFY